MIVYDCKNPCSQGLQRLGGTEFKTAAVTGIMFVLCNRLCYDVHTRTCEYAVSAIHSFTLRRWFTFVVRDCTAWVMETGHCQMPALMYLSYTRAMKRS